VYIAIPDVLQPIPHALFTRETGHHRIRQLQLELAIQRVDQLVLRFEVGKQRAFRNPGRTCNGCGRSTQPPLRENLDRGGQDRIAFIFALRFRRLAPLLLSIYSPIDEYKQTIQFNNRADSDPVGGAGSLLQAVNLSE
jgi:hypothetical protein